MNIKCLIVDDEELALNVLEKYIALMPSLKLVGKCDSAVEAITFLHNEEVDLLFLDINMPELSGLDMLKTLTHPPKVILTTAYSEYALESYEYGIVDYLLKPIKLERFIKAVNKVVKILDIKIESQDKSIEHKQTIFIKEDQISYNLEFNQILYIEAYGNYLKIHTTEKTYVTRETMQHIYDNLPQTSFLRVHKSFIVSIKKIKKLSGNILFINDIEIPVGNTYKNELLKALQS